MLIFNGHDQHERLRLHFGRAVLGLGLLGSFDAGEVKIDEISGLLKTGA